MHDACDKVSDVNERASELAIGFAMDGLSCNNNVLASFSFSSSNRTRQRQRRCRRFESGSILFCFVLLCSMNRFSNTRTTVSLAKPTFDQTTELTKMTLSPTLLSFVSFRFVGMIRTETTTTITARNKKDHGWRPRRDPGTRPGLLFGPPQTRGPHTGALLQLQRL
jgi:D-alanyl-lipoteichoic acid acyltransferase DltB (MBOAT superfamily)